MILSRFPDTIWLESGYNAGFSRANNMGIRSAKGEYILILNPDAEFRENVLAPYVAFYRQHDGDQRLGLLTCRIYSSVDDSLSIGTGLGFPSIRQIIRANPLYIYLCRILGVSMAKKYSGQEMHYQDHEVDFASGACALISRRKITDGRLYFDEDFFLYYEDVNWSRRVHEAGYRNYHCSSVKIWHVNSASTGRSWAKDMQIQVSSYLYYLRAYGPVMYALIGLTLWLNYRMTIYLLRRADQKVELEEARKSYTVFLKYFKLVWQKYYPSSPADGSYLRYEGYGDPS